MKLTIKTLRQETFEIELPETDTVLILKNKIECITKNELPANRMTLIYAGLILDNDRILKSYSISENKFIVAMIKPTITTTTSKVETKLSNDDQESPTTSTTISNKLTTSFTNNAESGIIAAVKTNANTTVTTTQTTTSPIPINTVRSTSSESILNSDEINNIIQNIIDVMGYPEHEVRLAFEASFNNPDRAVEYLINGVPSSIENIGLNMQAIQQSMNEQRPLNNNNSNLNINDRTSAFPQQSPLEFLRTDPQFYQMRMDLRENPELLETVILHIAETNPSLLHLIAQHQEDFVNIINEPIDGIDNDNIIDNHNSNGDYDYDENDQYERDNISDHTNDRQSSSLSIYMTPEDLDAINRLTSLGFAEVLCVQAYFACDKNEEQAANLLCSNQMDE